MKTFFSNLKKNFSIRKLVAITIIFTFIVGLFSIFNYFTSTSEKEWKQYETLAYLAYEAKGNLIEIPKHFTVNVETSKITVSHDIKFSVLEAYLKDGELVFKRSTNIELKYFSVISLSLLVIPLCVGIIVLASMLHEYVLLPFIYKMKKRRKSKKYKKLI